MKLTRNSYKRKLVLVGVLIFFVIALVSTGFATWIMSTNADGEESGGLEIGEITESKLAFSDISLSSHDFFFEPVEGDNSGVKWDGEHSENLSITITGKISPVDVLKDMTISLEIPEGVRQAAKAGYIVLPECANSVVTLEKNSDNLKLSGDGLYYEFTYEIAFKWGEKFEGTNPSKYYDENETGMAVPRDEVKTTLETMRSTIYGKPNEEIDLDQDKLTFKVSLTARSN